MKIHLKIVFFVRELEVPFLRLGQFSFQTLLRCRAPKLLARICPVPGPMEFETIALSFAEWGTNDDHLLK
jgi:hypothetical protein